MVGPRDLDFCGGAQRRPRGFLWHWCVRPPYVPGSLAGAARHRFDVADEAKLLELCDACSRVACAPCSSLGEPLTSF